MRRAQLFALFIALFTIGAFAEEPQINFSGYYKESDEAFNGFKDMSVSLWYSPSDTATAWTADYEDVVIKGGIYKIVLGPNPSLLTVDFAKDVWITIQIESSQPSLPVLLTSVPKAITARNVSGTIKSGTVMESGIAVSSLNGLQDSVKIIAGEGTTVETSLETNQITIGLDPELKNTLTGEKGDQGKGLQIDAPCSQDARNLYLEGSVKPNVYFTCYDPSTFEAFVWSVANNWIPLGDLRGIKGDKGDVGPKGETGPKGVKGDIGPKGDTGLLGSVGPKGDKGDKGDQGPQGPQGIKGDVGPKGDKGEKGSGLQINDACDSQARNDMKDAATKPDLYYTCVDPNTSEAFVWGETEDWINLGLMKGEKGDKGDKGDTGATGPKGDKGDKGDTGAKGDTGDKGDKGDTGAKGDTGDKGDRGEEGKGLQVEGECSQELRDAFTNGQGQPTPLYTCTDPDTFEAFVWGNQNAWVNLGVVKGDKGDKGDTGATGPKGDKGDTGATGPKGDKGDTGAAGPKGDKGDTGATGPKGDKGDTGAAGPKGDKGDTGATGPKGDKGNTGATGSKGDKGNTGPRGDPGDGKWTVNGDGSISSNANVDRIKFHRHSPGSYGTCSASTLGTVLVEQPPAPVIYLKVCTITSGVYGWKNVSITP